jgi:hypothetical protein
MPSACFLKRSSWRVPARTLLAETTISSAANCRSSGEGSRERLDPCERLASNHAGRPRLNMSRVAWPMREAGIRPVARAHWRYADGPRGAPDVLPSMTDRKPACCFFIATMGLALLRPVLLAHEGGSFAVLHYKGPKDFSRMHRRLLYDLPRKGSFVKRRFRSR